MPVNQQVITALRRFFTPAEVARILKTLPPRATPIMDLVYPERRRRQKAGAFLALSEIKDLTGAIPVVRKGSRSYSLDGGENTSTLIEPEAINPSTFIKASELNNAISLGLESSMEQLVADRIESLRNACRASTEIMAAQSLSGKISYPMATESGAFKNYEVDFGTIDALDAVDFTGKSYGDIRAFLEEQYMEQQNSGYAGDIRFLVAPDVYTAILNVVTALKTFPGQFTAEGLTLDGKYKLMPMGVTYKKPGAAVAAAVIPAKTIQTIDLAADHTIFYCAIDDLDAGLVPMPFFAKTKIEDDPSGIKVIGHSKPLPAPVLGAMKKRQVLA